MNERELDLENINQIDMECDVCDDDDSFGMINTKSPSKNFVSEEDEDPAEGDDGRLLETKTGIIINLNDDEEMPRKQRRVISADITPHGNLNIQKNFQTTNNSFADEYDNVNAIDMECDSCEDDDFGGPVNKHIKKVPNIFDLDDELDVDGNDDLTFDNKEFVDEDFIEEKKHKATADTTGKVEADYWKNLSKKHAATNKKGAYNTMFHFCGNPEKEMAMFNHDMTPAVPSPAPKAAPVVGDIGSIASVGGVSAGSGEVDGGDGGAAGGGGGESLRKTTKSPYAKKLNEMFNIIGFTVTKNPDTNEYTAQDYCDPENIIIADNKEDLIYNLKPYIDTCFIYPLQIKTGENFEDCSDWCDWYTADKKEKYPKCADDIDYCDLIANHLHDCD